jgi:hypothetical protein
LNSTSKTDVPKREGMQGLLSTSTRKRYGTVTVGGVDGAKVVDSTKKPEPESVVPAGGENGQP